MTDRIRVGVIGTGFGTAIHVPGFQALPDFEVTAICSAREDRAREAASKLGIPFWTTDYRQVLDRPDVDAVAIVTPPYLHREMTLAAIAAGKHVLCEKPMAMNVGEAQEMLDALERSGLTGMIDHEFRWYPARARAKELIDEGYLGEIRGVSVVLNVGFMADPEARPFGWLSQREKGGGMLGAMGSHLIDALHQFCGPITQVAAFVDHFVPKRRIPGTDEWGDVTSEDSFAMLFRFANGAHGTLQFSSVSKGTGATRFEIAGTEGVLVLHSDERLAGARGNEPLTDIEIPDRLKPPADLGISNLRLFVFGRLAQQFAQGVRGGYSPSPSFNDGLAVQRVMDAIYESADNVRIVSI